MLLNHLFKQSNLILFRYSNERSWAELLLQSRSNITGHSDVRNTNYLPVWDWSRSCNRGIVWINVSLSKQLQTFSFGQSQVGRSDDWVVWFLMLLMHSHVSCSLSESQVCQLEIHALFMNSVWTYQWTIIFIWCIHVAQRITKNLHQSLLLWEMEAAQSWVIAYYLCVIPSFNLMSCFCL